MRLNEVVSVFVHGVGEISRKTLPFSGVGSLHDNEKVCMQIIFLNFGIKFILI
jgi:hypothetical protein